MTILMSNWEEGKKIHLGFKFACTGIKTRSKSKHPHRCALACHVREETPTKQRRGDDYDRQRHRPIGSGARRSNKDIRVDLPTNQGARWGGEGGASRQPPVLCFYFRQYLQHDRDQRQTEDGRASPRRTRQGWSRRVGDIHNRFQISVSLTSVRVANLCVEPTDKTDDFVIAT